MQEHSKILHYVLYGFEFGLMQHSVFTFITENTNVYNARYELCLQLTDYVQSLKVQSYYKEGNYKGAICPAKQNGGNHILSCAWSQCLQTSILFLFFLFLFLFYILRVTKRNAHCEI